MRVDSDFDFTVAVKWDGGGVVVADSACFFTVAVKRGGGVLVAFGAEDSGMPPLFVADEFFRHFSEVVLAGVLDNVAEVGGVKC